MTKTLADMTAEERASCVGMWTDAKHCALQGIILGVFYDHARVLIPENVGEYSDEEEYIWVLKNVVPRFDLPRGWTPNGAPPKGKWVKRILGPGRNQMSWVGEWETDND